MGQKIENNSLKGLSLSSRAVHADDFINSHRAVAPPLHTSTTFRYDANPDNLERGSNVDPNAPYDSHVYSRYSAPNTNRLEALLSSYLGGPSLTYSSGLGAFHALVVFLNPNRVAMGRGYHGCHGTLGMIQKLKPLQILTLSGADLAKLEPGDILHVETPFNPTGEAVDLAYYRRVATERGAWLTCDATLAPPPLQDPFRQGVDVIVHSGTKYIGGHSDMLCGVLSVRKELEAERNWIETLRTERAYLGSVMGSLEGWLGVRSVRTLELRVERQARNALEIVRWLNAQIQSGAARKVLLQVMHASLQPEAKEEGSWLQRQMPGGYGAVFSILMKDEDMARRLPSKLHLFQHATSLGGVESLIEWRALADSAIDKRLLRLTIGVEAWEDLRDDMSQAFKLLAEESRANKM